MFLQLDGPMWGGWEAVTPEVCCLCPFTSCCAARAGLGTSGLAHRERRRPATVTSSTPLAQPWASLAPAVVALRVITAVLTAYPGLLLTCSETWERHFGTSDLVG